MQLPLVEPTHEKPETEQSVLVSQVFVEHVPRASPLQVEVKPQLLSFVHEALVVEASASAET